MTGAELSAPLLGLPLLLVAALLLALWVALFARASSKWSSLFGGLSALATVWLFATVALDKVWDALWLPKDALGPWLSVPNVIAALIALLAGGWLERRLRSEELGPVLTGVLEGSTPRNLYEWAASIGFLAFSAALVFMFSGPKNITINLGAGVIWLAIAGSVATGGGLLAGGMSGWRTSGRSTRVALLVLVGLAWCLAMDGLGRRLETNVQASISSLERSREALPQAFERKLADDDLSAEDRARYSRLLAWWTYIHTGVVGEHEDESGETVTFEPSEEERAAADAMVLIPAARRAVLDDASTFRSLWPWVALAGLALGLLRPLRAAPRPPTGKANG